MNARLSRLLIPILLLLAVTCTCLGNLFEDPGGNGPGYKEHIRLDKTDHLLSVGHRINIQQLRGQNQAGSLMIVNNEVMTTTSSIWMKFVEWPECSVSFSPICKRWLQFRSLLI